MNSYFDKRKQQKLYRQWVDKSGLPPESVPGASEEPDGPDRPPVQNGGIFRQGIRGGLDFHLTMRHLLYMALIIVVLLVATASLATVLIMRSC